MDWDTPRKIAAANFQGVIFIKTGTGRNLSIQDLDHNLVTMVSAPTTLDRTQECFARPKMKFKISFLWFAIPLNKRYLA